MVVVPQQFVSPISYTEPRLCSRGDKTRGSKDPWWEKNWLKSNCRKYLMNYGSFAFSVYSASWMWGRDIVTGKAKSKWPKTRMERFKEWLTSFLPEWHNKLKKKKKKKKTK